jgi:hypothetical protein
VYHPTYLSAHVTLGRALIELNQYPDARKEFEYVLLAAPDNLLARKGMNDLAARSEAPAPPIPIAEPAAAEARPHDPIPAPPAPDPALEELEGWKARIQADRAQRTGRTP